MKSKHYYKNRIFLGALIIIILLAVDIGMHKGMVRVLIPSSFIKSRPTVDFPHCGQLLLIHSKAWRKAIDSAEAMNKLPVDIAGFEVDVYFDSTINSFYVYHDSSGISTIKIAELLDIYEERNLSASIWFDFKNLNYVNHEKALNALINIRSRYNLQNKMLIESTNIQYLPAFCDKGFYTSYYTPFFNPYLLKENELEKIADSISNNLKLYPVSALSGYYFQYTFLKKYFPKYPILTWADKNNFSIVSYVFNNSLQKDQHLEIILYHEN
ncbi:MAG: hypothetical protein ABI683_13475 [Ginsengibacter sp.]